MNSKILNGKPFLFIFGYLEWEAARMFHFKDELVVLGQISHDPVAAAHPFTLIPLVWAGAAACDE